MDQKSFPKEKIQKLVLQYKKINEIFKVHKMGGKCFHPVSYNNHPVYLNRISNAFNEAKKISIKQKYQIQLLIDQIQRNQNRKGNLKKLFDHLQFHHKNIVPAIKYCRTALVLEKSFSSVIISGMFCQQLVKMLQNKRISFAPQRSTRRVKSQKSWIESENGFNNIIQELEGNFLELITEILTFSREKNIQNSISQTLIKYTLTHEEKIISKKQLRLILDLYLAIVFEKNIQLIDKNSFLSFYAYSILISKSKTELFTPDFIEKHFSFILKLFFELEETKRFKKSFIYSGQFSIFEQSINSIINQFIVFSCENKKIKEQILKSIMFEADSKKFDPFKISKLENFIMVNINTNEREQFMFDWLGYLVCYISKKPDDYNQNFKNSLMSSLYEFQFSKYSNSINSVDSRINSLDTLKRWFECKLLNTQRIMQYYSYKIFESLLLNLYSPFDQEQQLSLKSQLTLNYFLFKRPDKLSQIFLILNKQLRKPKNQYFYYPHFSAHLNGNKQKLSQEYIGFYLWQAEVSFLKKNLKIIDSSIILSLEDTEQLYAPLAQPGKTSINMLYQIELASICLQYVDNKSQTVQEQLYNFLKSLTNSIKINNPQIQFQFLLIFIDKSSILINQILHLNSDLFYFFAKYIFRHIVREDSVNLEVWTLILIVNVLIHIAFESKNSKNSQKLKQLKVLLQDIKNLRTRQFPDCDIYYVYSNSLSLFEIRDNFSNGLSKFNFQKFNHLQQKNTEINSKNLNYMENSALSSKCDAVSDTNPDSDFKIAYSLIAIN